METWKWVQVGSNDKGFFIIKLANAEDKERVWHGDSWVVQKQTLRVLNFSTVLIQNVKVHLMLLFGDYSEETGNVQATQINERSTVDALRSENKHAKYDWKEVRGRKKNGQGAVNSVNAAASVASMDQFNKEKHVAGVVGDVSTPLVNDLFRSEPICFTNFFQVLTAELGIREEDGKVNINV
ncbi:uncharacterized protein LOC113297887 [Papaver somniferum]|uniref:uncharacterized protein LOC113297887 n=1 Tax=Papaver somniferum TaxID=3469 RepID=UPI000E6F67FB|nr:uncharacterized protein LOC113297887 [Papaver somniferum]